MAEFTGTVLTKNGLNLISKAQAGATLKFSKVKVGDGVWSSNTDPTQLNDLVNPKISIPIQSIQVVGDGTVRIRFVLTNAGFQQGFFTREVGIYAQDPDLGEILYAVAYAGDKADFIPSDSTTKVENIVDIYTVIANTQNVSAVFSDTVAIATKQDVNIAKPEIGTTAPTNIYAGKLWFNTSNNYLQYYDGSNWQNVSVFNADKVDGFDASKTPAPNVIVPLNANGILDLSSTYIKSSVYSFRRVDLSNASSDYLLQVGEEAVVSFNNLQMVPLRIAVPEPASAINPVIYNIIIGIYWSSDKNVDFDFFPNNTTYSNQVSYLTFQNSDNGWAKSSGTAERFWIDTYGGSDTAPWFANLFAVYYGTQQPKVFYGSAYSNGSVALTSNIWNNTTNAWSSLGSFRIYPGSTRNFSGMALVRRLA